MTPGPLRPETIQRRLADIRALLDVLRRHADITGAQLRADLERRPYVHQVATWLGEARRHPHTGPT